jgi:transposase InsO family protein
MATTSIRLGDELLRIPKLSVDGKNWIVYKERLQLSLSARGLDGHLDGTTTKPVEPKGTTEATGTVTPPKAEEVETYKKELREFMQNRAIALQQIASTIPDTLYLRIKGKVTVKDAWDTLTKEFETRSRMFTIDLRRRLQDERCDDQGDVRVHFETMRTLREDLASLGEAITDNDFATMLLGSLPKGYDTYLSAITATMSVMGKTLDPDALMMTITDEYDRRAIRTRQTKEKGKEAAFYAGERSRNGGKGSKSSLECFNCHKKGHKKSDCWAKGGGKEGQGPRSRKARDAGGSKQDAGNAAADEDGVWTAFLDEDIDADDERDENLGLADSGDEFWFSDNEDDSQDPRGVIPVKQDVIYAANELPEGSVDVSDEDDDLPALQSQSESSFDEDDLSDDGDEPATAPGPGDADRSDTDDASTTLPFACIANSNGGPGDNETELYDSGATRHMSPHRNQLENYEEIAPKSITAADQRSFQATGRGDLRISIPNGEETTSMLLKGVLHCPDIGPTLVSVGRIDDAGYAVLFRNNTCKIYDSSKKLIGVIPKRGGLYRVDHSPGESAHAATKATETLTLEELHRMMGHIAPETARRLVTEGAVEGIDLDDSGMPQTCSSCEYAKTTRKPIQKTREAPRATKFGQEIHSDVWGPSPVMTPGKREYYSTFTDDYARWTHLMLQRLKSETFESYKTFEAWAKTQIGVQAIGKLRSDRGGEYLDNEFTKYLAAQGTQRILTTHDTPEYNGVAERLNRTLLERTRALLHASGLPKFLWGEAINHVVWLKNRTTSKALPSGKTPYELVYGRKPDLSGLHEWGAPVWVHDATGSKLDGRGRQGRWIGFDEASNAHRIYFEDNRTVRVERSVKFASRNVLVPAEISPAKETIIPTQETSQQPPTALETVNVPPAEPATPETPEVDQEAPGRPKRIRKPSKYVQRLQEGEGSADGRPNRPRIPTGVQIEEIHPEDEEDAADRGGVEHAMAAAIADAEALDPLSLEEARRRSDWKRWEEAIGVELDALERAGTWEVVERPRGRNIVESKWVFHLKKDADGKIERYKARLVAKGFTQVQGIDYFDTFAPVARLASIRTILAIAARNGWPIDMFDFHSAFLNGKLDDDEEVFMEQPPGFATHNRLMYCLHLFKSIYGLKQASRKWYDILCATLAELNFRKSEADPAVFYIHSGDILIILAIHVDDCTITGNSRDLIAELKVKLAAKYSLTDLGPAIWLLGIKITRNLEARTLALSQESYIDSILARFNFTDLKPLAAPMDPNIRFSKDQCPQTLQEAAEMRRIPYREALGSLMYCAVATRPDIAFPVGLLSQFVENPGRIHWEAVKRIYRYLSGTKAWRLVYGSTTNDLEGYTDADGASQAHRHAISGYAFLIDGGAVSWSSRKQELVTLSTAEAEYVAATHAAKEGLWLRRFIGEVFQPIQTPTTLYSDSKSAIALTQDGSYHARTKHIDIRYHFIRFVVQNGSIHLIYCPTEDMVADTLTKALPSTKAKHFASSLGLQSA